MGVTLMGIVTVVGLVQSTKNLTPINDNEVGKDIVVNPVHPSKA